MPSNGRAFVRWAALTALVLCAMSAAAAPAAPPSPPPEDRPTALSIDTGSIPELYPNQSVTGSLAANTRVFFKVFANRSDAAPETLALSIESTGSLFGTGTMAVYDPFQIVLDEQSTTGPGQQLTAFIIVAETGYYLVEVRSTQTYDWAVSVNKTVGAYFPSDNDNDLGNATVLGGAGGTAADNVTDWSDLADTFAVDLAVYGATRDALVVNLTSPNTADIDLFIFHVEAGLAVIDGLSISPTGFEYAGAMASTTDRYYIRVMSYRGDSAYTLDWSVRVVNADDNPSPPKASAATAGSSLNNLSRWDLVDFFAFDLTANTTVNVSFHTEGFNATTREPDLQAVMWDASIERVTWSFDFDPDERINMVAPSTGRYYLEVFEANFGYYLTTSMSFNYTMDVSVDPPPALTDPLWQGALLEDTAASFDLRVLAPADPATETLAFTVTGVTGPLAASLAADGHTLQVVPEPDASGYGSVTVTARDRWREVTFVLPFAVAPVNDPPRLREGAGGVSFDEDALGLFDPSRAFVDPEGDPFSLTAYAGIPPLQTSTDPRGVLLSAPSNLSGALSLSVTVADSLGANVTVSIAVTVRPVNDGPFFPTAPPPLSINEDAPAELAAFNLSGLAFDREGDALMYWLTGASSVSSLVVGEWIYLQPAPDFAGTVTGVLWVSDGLRTASAAFEVTVLPVDDAPALVLPPAPINAAEGSAFSYDAEASDIDSPLSSLTYTFALDGSPVNAAGGRSFSHIFDFESAGTHVLRVTVSDGARNASADVLIVVSATNRGPTAEVLAPRNISLKHGVPVTFSGRGVDPDGDRVNLTWIVDGTQVSSAATFSLDGLAPGRHTVDLRVTDGEFTATSSATFEVEAAAPGFDGALALVGLLTVALFTSRLARSDTSITRPKRLK